VRIRVDNPEDLRRPLSEPQHVKHVHVQLKLTNSPTASAERTTGVLAITTSRVATEAQSHTLCLLGQGDQKDGYCQQAGIFKRQHVVWQKLLCFVK